MEAVKGVEATAEAVVVAATVAVARAEEVTGVEKEVVVMVEAVMVGAAKEVALKAVVTVEAVKEVVWAAAAKVVVVSDIPIMVRYFFFVGSLMRRDENLRDIETVLNLHDQLTNTGWLVASALTSTCHASSYCTRNRSNGLPPVILGPPSESRIR